MLALSVLYVLSSMTAAVATHFLHKNELHVVLAACLIGAIGVGLEYLTKVPHLSHVVFAGAFVGMTSSAHFSYLGILGAGFLVGLLFLLAENHGKGFGGKLGALALIAVVLVYYILQSLKWIQK
jgi:hypothetical protein